VAGAGPHAMDFMIHNSSFILSIGQWARKPDMGGPVQTVWDEVDPPLLAAPGHDGLGPDSVAMGSEATGGEQDAHLPFLAVPDDP
jgi:hypothetical protein